MPSPLDLSGFFSGVARKQGDYPRWRATFYGVLSPIDFLVDSVDAARDAGVTLKARKGTPSSPLIIMAEVRDLIHELSDTSQVAADEDDDSEFLRLPRGFVTGGRFWSIDAGADVFRDMFRRAFLSSSSPREKAQLAFSYRCLRGKEMLGTEQVLAVILESYTHGPFFLYAGADGASAAYWEGGSIRGSSRDVKSLALVNAVFEEARIVLDRGLLVTSEDLPPRPTKGVVLLSVVTSSGIFSLRGLDPYLESSPFRPLFSAQDDLLQYLVVGGNAASWSLSDYEPETGDYVRRGLACLVDTALFFAFISLFFLVGGTPINKMVEVAGSPDDGLISLFLNSAPMGLPLSTLLVVFPLYMAVFPVLLAISESSSALGYASPGKWLFSITVRTVTHGPGSKDFFGGSLFFQALLRNFVKWYLSPLFFFTGFVWAFFHRQGRAWHDVISSTMVTSKVFANRLISSK